MSPTYLYMNYQLVSSKLPGIHKVCSSDWVVRAMPQ